MNIESINLQKNMNTLYQPVLLLIEEEIEKVERCSKKLLLLMNVHFKWLRNRDCDFNNLSQSYLRIKLHNKKLCMLKDQKKETIIQPLFTCCNTPLINHFVGFAFIHLYP